MRLGPARIGDQLGLRASTVNRVLRRKGMPRLHEVDLATRRALCGQIERCDKDAPGEFVHVRIKSSAGPPASADTRPAAASKDT